MYDQPDHLCETSVLPCPPHLSSPCPLRPVPLPLLSLSLYSVPLSHPPSSPLHEKCPASLYLRTESCGEFLLVHDSCMCTRSEGSTTGQMHQPIHSNAADSETSPGTGTALRSTNNTPFADGELRSRVVESWPRVTGQKRDANPGGHLGSSPHCGLAS